MKGEKLKDFLKSYAEILRNGIDISDELPLQMTVKMPAGGIVITTCRGTNVAFVSCDEGGGPSMPIGPVAMTFARLFVNLVNKHYEQNSQGEDNET